MPETALMCFIDSFCIIFVMETNSGGKIGHLSNAVTAAGQRKWVGLMSIHRRKWFHSTWAPGNSGANGATLEKNGADCRWRCSKTGSRGCESLFRGNEISLTPCVTSLWLLVATKRSEYSYFWFLPSQPQNWVSESKPTLIRHVTS